jgi:hypothetical protein
MSCANAKKAKLAKPAQHRSIAGHDSARDWNGRDLSVTVMKAIGSLPATPEV